MYRFQIKESFYYMDKIEPLPLAAVEAIDWLANHIEEVERLLYDQPPAQAILTAQMAAATSDMDYLLVLLALHRLQRNQ